MIGIGNYFFFWKYARLHYHYLIEVVKHVCMYDVCMYKYWSIEVLKYWSIEVVK